MDCWWVWMLWRMSGGQREPAERSTLLRWPVKNSIIPPSHLWLTPFFFNWCSRSMLSSKNIITATWTRVLIQSQPFTEIHHFNKSLHSSYKLQFDGISVNSFLFDLKTWHHFNRHNTSQSGKSDSTSTLLCGWFIWSVRDKQMAATLTSDETKREGRTELIEFHYITPLCVAERTNLLFLKLFFVTAITATQLHAWLYSLCPSTHPPHFSTLLQMTEILCIWESCLLAWRTRRTVIIWNGKQ